MNDTTTTIDLDQTEEETHNLFTLEVSDEALEAFAGVKGAKATNSWICDCLSYSCD